MTLSRFNEFHDASGASNRLYLSARTGLIRLSVICVICGLSDVVYLKMTK